MLVTIENDKVEGIAGMGMGGRLWVSTWKMGASTEN